MVRSSVNNRGVVRLVDEWNQLVTLLDQVLVKAHEEILDGKCKGNCPLERLVEIYGLWRGIPRETRKLKR